MAGNLNLAMVLRADASGFKGEVRSAGAEVKALAGEAQRAGASIGSRIEEGTARASRALARGASSAVNLRSAFSQLGFQAQDIAIQLQAGISPLQVFAIQGGQAAAAFGPLGVALGSVITVGGIVASTLFGLARDTGELAEAQDILSGRLGEGVKSADELRAAYAELGAEARALQRSILGTAIIQANQEMAEARTKVRELAAEMERTILVAETNVGGSLPILAELLRVREGATDAGAAIGDLVARTEGLAPGVASMAVELVNQLKEIDENAKIVARSEAERAVIEGNATREQIVLLKDKAAAVREAAKIESAAEREADQAADRALQRRRQAALQWQETTGWIVRQREETKAYEEALREADRRGMQLANGLTGGLERAIFATGTITERMAEFGEELARVLLRMFALQPLAQSLGAGFSSFFAPGTPTPATGPGGLAVGGGVTSQLHEGGIVGRDGVPRLVSSSAFAGARRMHSGGIAGLRPGEVPAILESGEMVLPRGSGGGAVVNNFNVINQVSGTITERTERRRPDGGVEVDVVIRDAVSRQLGRGDHDRALGARFGLEPRSARR